MKKIILLALVILVFTACKKDDEKDKAILDPTAMLSIKIERSDNTNHLTPLEIVEQITAKWYWNIDIITNDVLSATFGDSQRDIGKERLLMYATDIIDKDGKYVPNIIEGTDIVFAKEHADGNGMDTIAYIKNETLRIASIQCRVAYDREDYTECYRVFSEALTLIPITATEWREVRASENPELIGTVWRSGSGSIKFQRTTFELNDGYVLKGNYTCLPQSVMLDASRGYNVGTLGKIIDGNQMTINNTRYTKE